MWESRWTQSVALSVVLAWSVPVYGTTPWTTPGQPDAAGGYSSSQIVVKLTTGARDRIAAARGRGLLAHGADPRTVLSEEFQTVSTEWRVSQMRPAYPDPFGDAALAGQHGLAVRRHQTELAGHIRDYIR